MLTHAAYLLTIIRMDGLQAKITLLANVTVPLPIDFTAVPVSLPQYSEILGAFLFGFVELTGAEGSILPEQKILVANGELDRIVIRDDPELNATETETYITVADLDHFSCAGALRVVLFMQ
jgi:hypothetical protein